LGSGIEGQFADDRGFILADARCGGGGSHALAIDTHWRTMALL